MNSGRRSTSKGSPDAGSGIRRYDLDWLRVLAVLMLIPFHTAIMFDVGGDFYVKNAATSRFLTEAANFIGVFGMPLLFFVAGAAGWFALGKYGWRRFLKERAFRLLLPLLVAMPTIVPLMGYFGRLHHAGTRVSFWEYYPKFFTPSADDLTGFRGNLSPGHLWFVLFLFGLTLAALPIFVWLQGARGRRFPARAAGFLSKPGMTLLIPVILFFTDGFPELAGRNVAGFFIYLVAGFLWMSHPRFQETVDRQRYLMLTISVLTGILFVALRTWGERQSGMTAGAAAFDLLRDTFSWTAVTALLGFSHARLNRPGGVIRYLGRASYPLYILHLPVVVALGYFVARWDAGIAVKFVAITAGSFAATLIVYELLVRRIGIVGRMFSSGART